MNRAEKRHRRKNAQNAAKNAMHGQATDHSFVQQTKALRKTLDLAIQYHTTGDFPKAENFYQNVFSIPNYPALKSQEVTKVVNSIFNLIN